MPGGVRFSQNRSNWIVATTFLRFSGRFWWGPLARQAWGLSISIVVVTLVMVAGTVAINRWMAVFFNSIEARDSDSIWTGLQSIAVYGLVVAVCAGLWNWIRQRLQIAWRECLTRELLARWTAVGNHHMIIVPWGNVDSPEFRITEDVRACIDPLVDFATSLVYCIVTAVAFVSILWTVGGSITLGESFEIPGYMVWLAVLYAFVASGLVTLIGRPLIRSNERKNAMEAALRGDLVLLSEHSDRGMIADTVQDSKSAARDLAGLFARWRAVALHQSKVAGIVSANNTFMPIVPLLAGAPKFLAGTMTLGALVQLGAAFTQTQLAFNWLFDNYIRIAEWLASAVRVVVLLEGLAEEAGVGVKTSTAASSFETTPLASPQDEAFL